MEIKYVNGLSKMNFYGMMNNKLIKLKNIKWYFKLIDT
jgi:hypothetical protein